MSILFLRTLAYTSNKKIVHLFKNTPVYVIASTPDEHGKHPSRKKANDEVIRAIDLNISSANPSMSHYNELVF